MALTQAHLDQLAKYDTPTICNMIELAIGSTREYGHSLTDISSNLDEDIEIQKLRRRHASRRHTGHRQKHTRVKITGITGKADAPQEIKIGNAPYAVLDTLLVGIKPGGVREISVPATEIYKKKSTIGMATFTVERVEEKPSATTEPPPAESKAPANKDAAPAKE